MHEGLEEKVTQLFLKLFEVFRIDRIEDLICFFQEILL